MKVFLGRRFSCALNYQHRYICTFLANRFEITENVEEADILVFPSTCSCTEDTIKSSLAYVYQCVQKKKPTAKVYLTGCLTRKMRNEKLNQWMEDRLKEYADYVIPHNTPNLLLQGISEDFNYLNPEEFGCSMPEPWKNKTTLYVGNGCLHNCAFCKVSYQHYPLKSVPIEEVKEAIAKVETPIVELIATNISEYGLDLYQEPRLPELIECAERNDKIEETKIIGVAYQDAIKYHFEEPFRDSNKITYVSGSLETGSPRLLEMIRKGFTPEQIIAFAQEMKRKRYRRMDLNIIAGLPTETLEDVKATLSVLKEIDPYSVQISEYVNSSILDLNKLPQLSDEEIRERSRMYEKVLTRRRVKNHIMRKPQARK